MNKTLVALAGIAALMVISYLGYELLAPNVNQCESIFQQTAPGLDTNIKFLESEGGVVLGRKQIQELSDRAQQIALNLKSCCVMAGSGNLEQFNQCKASTFLYDWQVAEAVETVKAVAEAPGGAQDQKQIEAEKRLATIIESANAASATLKQEVEEISAASPDSSQPSTGNGGASQGPGALRLRAALTKGGDQVGACYDIYEPKQDLEGNRTHVARRCDDPSIFELPAGRYFLFTTAGQTSVESEITVGAGQATDEIVDLHAGYLRTRAELVAGGEKTSACFDVYEFKKDVEGNRKQVARACDEQPTLILPAGDYVLSAQSGQAVRSTDIKIGAGQITDQTVVLDAGYLRAHAELTSGGEQVEACFDVYDPKEDSQGNLKQVARACGQSSLLMLPAGTYALHVQSGHAATSLDVTITAGHSNKQPVTLNAGYLRMQAQFADDGQMTNACFDVYETKQDAYGNRTAIGRMCTEKAVFTLPAGSYFVQALSGDASAEMTVDVTAGDITDRTLSLPRP